MRLYCKWFLHPFGHCLRPKLIAKEASLKPCHENQGSVSGCQRRTAPPLRLRGCSAFSRAGIHPAPCTCLSILSLIQGFLSLLSSVLGKQHQLCATSSLFPDDEEIFLLSSNHSCSTLPISCTQVLPQEKLTNWVTARHRHCQMCTCMRDNFDPSFEPEFLSLPHLQRLWCAWWCKVGESCTTSSNPNPNTNSCHRSLGIRMLMASSGLCFIWQPACLAPVHFSI